MQLLTHIYIKICRKKKDRDSHKSYTIRKGRSRLVRIPLLSQRNSTGTRSFPAPKRVKSDFFKFFQSCGVLLWVPTCCLFDEKSRQTMLHRNRSCYCFYLMDFDYSCSTVRVLPRMQKLCQLVLVPFASLTANIVSPSSIKHGYFCVGNMRCNPLLIVWHT